MNHLRDVGSRVFLNGAERIGLSKDRVPDLMQVKKKLPPANRMLGGSGMRIHSGPGSLGELRPLRARNRPAVSHGTKSLNQCLDLSHIGRWHLFENAGDRQSDILRHAAPCPTAPRPHITIDVPGTVTQY